MTDIPAIQQKLAERVVELEMILRKLLENATDHSHYGGYSEVRTEYLDRANSILERKQ